MSSLPPVALSNPAPPGVSSRALDSQAALEVSGLDSHRAFRETLTKDLPHERGYGQSRLSRPTLQLLAFSGGNSDGKCSTHVLQHNTHAACSRCDAPPA